MTKIFTDASTPIDEANLNKLLAAGGTFLGLHMFTAMLWIKNNAGTYQYTLKTGNNVVNNEILLGNLGASNITTATNVGDGNVDKPGVGAYDIIISGITNLFAMAGNFASDDSNVVVCRILADPPGNKISASFRNASGVNTDLATTKTSSVSIIGAFN